MSALTLSPQALHDALRPLVGGRVRRATEGDAVAGVRPPVVVEPGGEEGVAAALAFADREGLKVLVRRGGCATAACATRSSACASSAPTARSPRGAARLSRTSPASTSRSSLPARSAPSA